MLFKVRAVEKYNVCEKQRKAYNISVEGVHAPCVKKISGRLEVVFTCKSSYF